MTGINWNGGSRNNHARSGNKSRYQQSQNQNQFNNRSVNKAIQGIRKHGMKTAGGGGGGKKSRQNHQNDRINQQFNFPWATEDVADQIEESETYLEPSSRNRWGNESQMRKKALEANNYDLLRKLEEINQVNDLPEVSQVLAINDWSGIHTSNSSSQDPILLPIPSRSLLPSRSSILSNPNQFDRDLPPHFYLPTPTESFYANPNFPLKDANFLPPQAVKTLSRYDSKTAEDELNAEIEREKRLKEVLRSRKNKLLRVQTGGETQSSLEEGEILEFQSSSASPTTLPLFRPEVYSSDDMEEEVAQMNTQYESQESDEFEQMDGVELEIPLELHDDPSIDADLPSQVPSPIASQAEVRVAPSESVKSLQAASPSRSPSPPPLVEPSIETSYFEALAASISNFEPLSPSFFAPQRVTWNSVCCLTSLQRQELSKSWKFKNRFEKVEKLETDLEKGSVLLGERMGIGCLGIKSRDYGRYDAILRSTSEEAEKAGESGIGSDSTTRETSQLTSPIDFDIQQDLPLQPSSASQDDNISSSCEKISLPQTTVYHTFTGSGIQGRASSTTDFDSFYDDLLKSACVDLSQSQAAISRSSSPMEIIHTDSEGESLVITTLVPFGGENGSKKEEVLENFGFDIFSKEDTYGVI